MIHSRNKQPRKSQDNDDGDDESIVMFKLVSGESIIARVAASDEEKLLVKDPVEIQTVTETSNGRIVASLYYSEWITGSISTVYTIPKSTIITAAVPSKESSRRYIETLVATNLKQKQSPTRPAKKASALDEFLPDNDRWNYRDFDMSN